jgi:hypothetical protein
MFCYFNNIWHIINIWIGRVHWRNTLVRLIIKDLWISIGHSYLEPCSRFKPTGIGRYINWSGVKLFTHSTILRSDFHVIIYTQIFLYDSLFILLLRSLSNFVIIFFILSKVREQRLRNNLIKAIAHISLLFSLTLYFLYTFQW